MHDLRGARLRFWLMLAAVLVLMSGLSACRDSGSESAMASGAQVDSQAESQALSGAYSALVSLNHEDDADNRRLMEEVTVKLGLVSDDEQRAQLAEDLDAMIEAAGAPDAVAANVILADFSDLLDEVLLPQADSNVQPCAFAGLKAAEIRVVVSDGITRRGCAGESNEILPNAVVYAVRADKDESLINYVTARRISGAPVQFYYRRKSATTLNAWHKLGTVLTSDSDGRVALKRLAPLIQDGFFPDGVQGQIDLQLKAEVLVSDGLVSDDKGLLRILSEGAGANRRVILTDHDNTLHETGGPNAAEDLLDSANCLKKEWPLVDATASAEVTGWLNAGNDMIIVTGMSENMRAKAREQMALHFEGGSRRVPIVVKHDTAHDETNTFKAEIITILKQLYGDANIAAMVGDTVRQDGYGAFASGVDYVPFQIHYKLDSGLLDSEGYGAIDPRSIAWTWQEVIDRIEGGGLIPANFWRRNKAFMNIAHRGGGKLAPEDTLAAYRNAIRIGADAIEGDCHLTKDGVLVVSHDATVDRCTDGSGAIENLTYAELRQLDAGYRFTPDKGRSYPYRGKGVKIPSVREVFEMLTSADYAGVPMILELKSERNRDLAVRKLMDLILEFDQGSGRLVNRLQLGAFNQQALDYMQAIGGSAPYNFDIVRCFATEGVTSFVATPVWQLTYPDYERPGEVLDLPYALITPIMMDKARRTGLNVYVWTVNTRLEMLWLKNVMHVDGVMTDDPALLAEVIAGS